MASAPDKRIIIFTISFLDLDAKITTFRHAARKINVTVMRFLPLYWKADDGHPIRFS
jgi:hypothetical protein